MVYRNGRDECWHCGSTTHDTSECSHRRSPQYTPEFWTAQELTEVEINEICGWLMTWQKACVSGDCIASDYVEKTEDLPSQKLDPAFKTAMRHIESLVRHLGALRKTNV